MTTLLKENFKKSVYDELPNKNKFQKFVKYLKKTCLQQLAELQRPPSYNNPVTTTTLIKKIIPKNYVTKIDLQRPLYKNNL